jgi:O-antigen/teichoic acid export membrane protein
MRRQISNFVYGLLDYAAYPIGMLILAPFILRNLGVAQYGIWTVTASIVSIGSIIASGFGDATIQKIATLRSGGNLEGVPRVVRAAMGIHLVLGVASSVVIWSVSGLLADRLAFQDTGLRSTCVWCIRIAAVLTALRAIEAVCISVQRAFERYGSAVRTSVAGRVLGLVAAAVLASCAQGIIAILVATTLVVALAVGTQMIGMQRLLETREVSPTYEGAISKDLLQFGAFTWMLAATGVVFSQADRLMGGASFGAAAIVSYALCAQLSQPVYGLTAAGLHFLSPYIASRYATAGGRPLKKTLMVAVLANVALVLIGAGLLLVISDRILHLLSTEELARVSAPLFKPVLAGSTLLALSVAGNYAMVAMGRVRIVALVNVIACAAIVAITAMSLRSLGVMAMAGGRIAFALIALCVYIPLAKEMWWRRPLVEDFASGDAVGEMVEGA